MRQRRAATLAVLALLIVGCAPSQKAPQALPAVMPTESSPPTVATTRPVPAPTTSEVPAATAVVATAITEEVTAYASAALLTVTWSFPNPTQFGGPRVFLVMEESGDALRVQLPVRPNGTTGWIARSAVELAPVTHRAEIDLGDARLRVWDGAELIADTTAAIGKEATPTPTGRFYVRDHVERWEGSAYGPNIIALSGFSEVLESFQGGLPAIAIHGTDQPGRLGEAVSNGCVRIPNEIITQLAATVPLGTPVDIVR